jgi:hypothetical protein
VREPYEDLDLRGNRQFVEEEARCAGFGAIVHTRERYRIHPSVLFTVYIETVLDVCHSGPVNTAITRKEGSRHDFKSCHAVSDLAEFAIANRIDRRDWCCYAIFLFRIFRRAAPPIGVTFLFPLLGDAPFDNFEPG